MEEKRIAINQSDYQTIKIPKETMRNLRKALKKKRIKSRSNAEAINILINNFLLSVNENKKEKDSVKTEV